MEPLADQVVSGMQNGFLRGRSIMRNGVDIDLESMVASLSWDRPALVLFDFEAAFPSISHDFIFEALACLGLPSKMINVIRCLYTDNRCNIKVKGGIYEGFSMTSGVRQG